MRSSNIKVVTPQIWEDSVLTLLMEGIYEVHGFDTTSDVMLYIPSLIKIGLGVQVVRGDTHPATQTHTGSKVIL
jgi:hypothetical protein